MLIHFCCFSSGYSSWAIFRNEIQWQFNTLHMQVTFTLNYVWFNYTEKKKNKQPQLYIGYEEEKDFLWTTCSTSSSIFTWIQ